MSIKEELDHCNYPYYLFDNDVDGLCSFLLLYRYKKEGIGLPVKVANGITEIFIRKVEPSDKIFVLDVAEISEEFIRENKKPVVWVDHHPTKANVITFKGNKPTSRLCYDAIKQDEWIALTGVVGDWTYDKELINKVEERFFSRDIKTAPEALFKTDAGKLAKILNFILKGDMKGVKKIMNVLIKINDPYEILDKTSSRGKIIYKKFEMMNVQYEELLKKAKKNKKNKIFFVYDEKNSFTSELSNELLFLNPNKLIVVARKSNGEMKMSIRASKPIRTQLLKVLEELEGRGGGHECACGGSVSEVKWEEFVKLFSDSVNL